MATLVHGRGVDQIKRTPVIRERQTHLSQNSVPNSRRVVPLIAGSATSAL